MTAGEPTLRLLALRGVRKAMREVARLVQALNDGLVERLALVRRGRIVAVMLDVDDCAEMVQLACAGGR